MEMTLTVHTPRRRPRPVDVIVRWSGAHEAADLCTALAAHLRVPVPFLTSHGRPVPRDDAGRCAALGARCCRRGGQRVAARARRHRTRPARPWNWWSSADPTQGTLGPCPAGCAHREGRRVRADPRGRRPQPGARARPGRPHRHRRRGLGLDQRGSGRRTTRHRVHRRRHLLDDHLGVLDGAGPTRCGRRHPSGGAWRRHDRRATHLG